MKYFVNENCIGCGLCTGICPNIFDMSDEGTAKALDEDVSLSDESAAQDAMNGCPVRAIEHR